MEAVFIMFVLTLVFGLLAVAARRWGVDSRDGSADPRRPVTGLSV